jgi:DNA-directed RNA polymerase specialized sigma24 family protein
MLARKQGKSKQENGTAAPAGLPVEVRRARKHLRIAGWSYREAAEILGVNFTHLALVLTAKRDSKRLLGRVMGLGEKEEI